MLRAGDTVEMILHFNLRIFKCGVGLVTSVPWPKTREVFLSAFVVQEWQPL